MTTTTSAEPCWTLVMPDGSEPEDDGYGIPHFDTEADARKYLADVGENPIGQCIPQRLAAPCVELECVRCGYRFDEDDEGVACWESREQAEKELAGEWTFVGDDAFCSNEDCAKTAVKRARNLKVVDEFNAAHPVGTRVRYWRGVREGEGAVGQTPCEAWLLGGHSPVVRITGTSGAIALTHVQPLDHDAEVRS